MNKEELLKLVEEFIINEPNKKWRPGKDHVHYAGPYFDHKEIVRSVSTLLDGWLVLGSEAYKAEKKLASLFIASAISCKVLSVSGAIPIISEASVR